MELEEKKSHYMTAAICLPHPWQNNRQWNITFAGTFVTRIYMKRQIVLYALQIKYTKLITYRQKFWKKKLAEDSITTTALKSSA